MRSGAFVCVCTPPPSTPRTARQSARPGREREHTLTLANRYFTAAGVRRRGGTSCTHRLCLFREDQNGMSSGEYDDTLASTYWRIVRAMLMTNMASCGASRSSFGCARLARLRNGFSASRIDDADLRTRRMSSARGPRFTNTGCSASICLNSSVIPASWGTCIPADWQTTWR